VVKVCMGEHHRVEGVERIDLGHVDVGDPVCGAPRLLAAVYQYLAFPASISGTPPGRPPGSIRAW